MFNLVLFEYVFIKRENKTEWRKERGNVRQRAIVSLMTWSEYAEEMVKQMK